MTTWDVADPIQPALLGEQNLTDYVWQVRMSGGTKRLALWLAEDLPGSLESNDYLSSYDYVEGTGWVRSGRVVVTDRDVDFLGLSGESASAGCVAWHESSCGVHVLRDDSISALPDAPTVLPDRLRLAAAPNPFNPRTVLDFMLEKPGPARLAVYDLMGREVAVMLEGRQPAGARQVVFDGDGLASGLYLARLETARGARTVKLALVR